MIKFEPFQSWGFDRRPFPLKSIVAEYHDKRWRGTVVRGVKKDHTGVDEMRLMQEARDAFISAIRARNDPFPPD